MTTRIIEIDADDLNTLSEASRVFETLKALLWGSHDLKVEPMGLALILEPHIDKLTEVAERFKTADDAGRWKPEGDEKPSSEGSDSIQ